MDDRGRESRTKLSRRVYLAFVCFLALALLQWVVISIIPDVRELCRDIAPVFPITFCLAALLFCLFLFFRRLRIQVVLKWLVPAAIVELYVISMFILATSSWLPEILVYFIICLLVMIVALVIGCNLSVSMDLTESIAPILIASFIMAGAAMYPLMVYLFVKDRLPYVFAAFELILSLVMLLLVALHAQTIKGDRFIQMNTDDFLLAALLLFHEFLAIYAMTFYWQVNYAFFTPKDFIWMSTDSPSATAGDKYDMERLNGINLGSYYDFDQKDKGIEREKPERDKPQDVDLGSYYDFDDGDKSTAGEKPGIVQPNDIELGSNYDSDDGDKSTESEKRGIVQSNGKNTDEHGKSTARPKSGKVQPNDTHDQGKSTTRAKFREVQPNDTEPGSNYYFDNGDKSTASEKPGEVQPNDIHPGSNFNKSST